MIRRLGALLERFFRAVTPDPFVLAVLLTLVTAGLALALTDAGPLQVLEAWQGPRGFWGLLAFSMQMSLVLVTGHALASAPIMVRGLSRLSQLPRSGASAGALVALVAIVLGLVNWGLGLVAGALMAREMGRACERRGLRAHYPLLAAAGYTGMMTWHGGFSGSAPLKVTTQKDLLELLGPELSQRIEPVSIHETLLSPLNLVVTGGLVVLVPVVVWLLTPPASECVGIGTHEIEEASAHPDTPAQTIPERLERSAWAMLLLALPLLAWLVVYFARFGVAQLDPNIVNLTLLTVGLVAHGTLGGYARAVQAAVGGCAGIILQFPLYGGIMGMMSETGLARVFAEWAVSASNATTYPVLTFYAAGLINLFVPSGGGQWAVQGPIAAEAALTLGVPLRTAVMAVAYGDQWTNMLQPFWALPLLGITGVKAREIVGYTATIMLIAGVWISIGLLLLG